MNTQVLRRFPLRLFILLSLPIILALLWMVIKANRDRAFVPFQHIEVPNDHPRRTLGIPAATFSPDNRMLAISDGRSLLRTWDINQARFTQKIPNGYAESLSWNQAGKVALGYSGSAKVLDIANGKIEFQVPPAGRMGVVSERATLALISQKYAQFAVWDLKARKRRFVVNTLFREPCGLAVAPDDSVIAVANVIVADDKYIKQWRAERKIVGVEIAICDAATGKVQRVLRWDDANIMQGTGYGGNTDHIALAFSKDNRVIASADASGVTLWDTRKGSKVLQTEHSGNKNSYGHRHVAMSPDGRLVAGVYASKTYVWSTQSGQLLQWFSGPKHIRGLTFSPDSRLLLTSGQENRAGIVKVWNVARL